MIPLYRGELHNVSAVPRQWAIPKTQIPLSAFRKAVRKRDSAMKEFMRSKEFMRQSSNTSAPVAAAQDNTNNHATPVANGTADASLNSGGELGKHGGSENDDYSTPDDRIENGVGSSGCKPASSTDRSERGEEETERRQERKRRREEDYREVSGRGMDRRDDSALRDCGELESPSRGKCKVSHEGAEPMIVDSVDQRAVDCDVKDEDNTVDGDVPMPDVVRVRVNEVGNSLGVESKQGDSELGEKMIPTEVKRKDAGNLRRNGELAQPAAVCTPVSSFEERKSAQDQRPPTAGGNSTSAGPAELKAIEEQVKRKEELEAKLEKLRGEKHRFVLRLKQVLNEEEVKKRGSLASGSPATIQGAVACPNDSTGGVSTHAEKHGIGGPHNSGDLEDGELEYARTPSPPLRPTASIHGTHSSLGPPGLPPPQAAVIGRQTSLSQHISQTASGRGAYYVPSLGIPPSPAPPGVPGGAQSPGAGFMGNLPSPLGYSHNMAFQHPAAIHAQKVTPVSHGHGQFSPAPSSGGHLGAGPPGVAGGPPGFSGYPISSSVHSHHSHLSQPASSSSPHIAGPPGVSSSSILTNPRVPPGYHDIRMGGGAWIQR